jgi:hypothetical protein
LTPQDIVKDLDIKETDFDEYGNLKGFDLDESLINNGTEDEKTKYEKQFKQLKAYMESKKKATDKMQKEITAAVKKESSTLKGTTSNTISSNQKSAIDTAISSSTAQTSMISELRRLDIHREANLMVKYLQSIAQSQSDLVKFMGKPMVVGSGRGGAGTGSNSMPSTPTSTNIHTLPANIGFDRKNVSGKKDYGAIHSKNIEIAKGGAFKTS